MSSGLERQRKELPMLRTVALAAAFAAAQVLFTAASVAESEFATPGEASRRCDEAGRGESARDVRQRRGRISGQRPLDVWYANASDGILTVHPTRAKS